MRKGIVLGIVLVIGLIGVVLGNSSNYVVETANINIEEGWNLIPLIYDYHIIDESSEIQLEDIIVAYIYSPIDNEYVRYIENGEILGKDTSNFWVSEEEIKKIASSKSSLFTSDADARNLMFGMSTWIYTEKSGNMKISVSYDSDGDKSLIKGWNFLTITPDITGKRVSEWSGNCKVINVYGWENRKKDWVTIEEEPTFVYFSEDTLGKGFIIKVAEDCFIGSSGANPPELPGDEDTGNIDNCDTLNWDDSFCIDDLPDFPESIGNFSLYQYNKKNWEAECGELEGGEICSKSMRAVYYNNDTKEAIHFIPAYLTKGEAYYKNYIIENLVVAEVETNVFRLVERWELFWSTNTEFDYIMTQTYLYEQRDDGSTTSGTQTADVNHEVIQYFLNKYPAI